jgi:UDP-glucose 4-epimerase
MNGVQPPIAVIGAAGFLGTALVRAATREGVACSTFTRQVPFVDEAGRPGSDLVAARTVYWMVSSVNPALAEAEPHRVVTDREAFEALLLALAPLPEPPRVVLLSSGGTVYDPSQPPPYRETSPTSPVGVYGRSKLELERRLADAGLGVAIRVANAYGPGQPARGGQGVIGYWLRALAAGNEITIIGDPGTTRDYVYMDDVASALLAVNAATGPLPPAINVGSGQPVTLEALAELVRETTGSAAPIRRQEARGFDVPHTWLDITLAGTALGWKPRTELRDGLAAAWREQSGLGGTTA